jgi:hypothetical protein
VTPLPIDLPPLPPPVGGGWLYAAMPPNTEPVAKRHLRFGCTARPTTAVPDWRDGEEEKVQEEEEGEHQQDGQMPLLFEPGDLEGMVAGDLDIDLVSALESAPPKGGVEEMKAGEGGEDR